MHHLQIPRRKLILGLFLPLTLTPWKSAAQTLTSRIRKILEVGNQPMPEAANMGPSKVIDEVSEYRLTGVPAGTTSFFGKYFHKVKVDPSLKKRVIWCLAENARMVAAAELWAIHARLDFLRNESVIGSINIDRGTAFSGLLPNSENYQEEGPVGNWPSLKFDITPGSPDFKHSITVPAWDSLRIECDTIGLYVSFMTADTATNASFLTGIRCISTL